jgi:hypothetical protein
MQGIAHGLSLADIDRHARRSEDIKGIRAYVARHDSVGSVLDDELRCLDACPSGGA